MPEKTQVKDDYPPKMKKTSTFVHLQTPVFNAARTVLIRCPLWKLLQDINFYIAISPCQYDNKEILRQLGSVRGPNFVR